MQIHDLVTIAQWNSFVGDVNFKPGIGWAAR
jgi:hypothetical protein